MFQSLPFLDLKLDSSEYYDYDLAETMNDFIIRREEILAETFYLLTENGFVLTTEDNYRLRYD